MKIEKINEQQIRCILSKKELEDREIKISELASGSNKARGLFQDMIERANDEFGFDAEDIPLMIEAIPLAGEQIILQITKLECPEGDANDCCVNKLEEEKNKNKEIFEFKELNKVEQLAKKTKYSSDLKNDLYKNDKTKRFFLVVRKKGVTEEEYSGICKQICEFSECRKADVYQESWIKEHATLLVKTEALQTLKKI